jgi:cbb3-type cytochrome c oxidase subunit I
MSSIAGGIGLADVTTTSTSRRFSFLESMATPHSAARLFIYSATFWVAITDTLGLVTSGEFVDPDLFGGIPWMEFGRIRAEHVNGVTFLWLSMGYVGCFFYIVPKLCGRPLYSERLGNLTGWLWNIWGVALTATLGAGLTQAREYAEAIWPLDILFLVILGLVAYNVFMTIASRLEPKMFVSLWYIIGALVWFPNVYAIGNVIWNPPYGSLQGIDDSVWNWFYGHNILGLWFTTGGVGIAYYMIPAITRTPIYSHLLSLVGFWTLGLFYTMVGQHHLLQTPTPGWLKTVATLGSISLFVPVLTFITNIFMTMRGNWQKIYESVPLKFVITGVIFYLITCIQGPFQATQTFNRLIHFTQWIIGHAHLALLGAFTFILMGACYYIIPITLGRRIYSVKLAETQFWLMTLGFLGFFISLQIAGLIQGACWMTTNHSVYWCLTAIRPYLIIRSVSGALMVSGGWIQLYNLYKTATAGQYITAAAPAAAEAGGL